MNLISLNDKKLYCLVKTLEGFKTTRLYYNTKDIRLKIDYENYYLVNSINLIDGLITITVPGTRITLRNNFDEDLFEIILSFNQVSFYYEVEQIKHEEIVKLTFDGGMWKERNLNRDVN